MLCDLQVARAAASRSGGPQNQSLARLLRSPQTAALGKHNINRMVKIPRFIGFAPPHRRKLLVGYPEAPRKPAILSNRINKSKKQASAIAAGPVPPSTPTES